MQFEQAQKQLIRTQSRKLRQAISSEQALRSGEQLCHQLQSLKVYQQAQSVACYISFDGEINTNKIINAIQTDNKICLLPKLKPLKPNRLWFMPYKKSDCLLNNRFGIPEVDLCVSQSVAVSKINLLLMPLVAFDETGSRLGMGGGFYDATLAHLKLQMFNNKKPVCLGLAYEAQKFVSIPVQKWDYPLDGVVTEKRVYWF